MISSAHNKIFEAVKNDDAELFASFVLEKKSVLFLCFGRFPLLSLCYLYKSKKIVKAYERELDAVTLYEYTEETFEMYREFKRKAKKCLRFYVFGKNLVTPAEMLALTGEFLYLEEAYPRLRKDKNTEENITKIFKLLYGQNVVPSDDKIAVRKIRLTKFQKICVMLCLVLAAVMIALPPLLWKQASGEFGFGTEESPNKISNAAQLESALKNNGKYNVLSEDIYLPPSWNFGAFSGSIDGKGHTVYLPPDGGAFVSALTGSISDIRFVINATDIDLKKSKAFIADENAGKIKNIKIAFTGNLTESSADNELYLSLITLKNNGEISGCNIEADISFSGNGEGNAYLCGAAAINNGMVIGGRISAGSKLITDTVDVAGFVSVNNTGGTVKDCINNGIITQTSASNQWLPNVAGIVSVNSGLITDCVNNGKMTAVSTATDKILEVIAGGIVSVNNNKVTKCKNNANIVAASVNYNVYAGGVVSQNLGEVSASCSYGKISVSTENETGVFLFAGGIAGYSEGLVSNSYSASSFECGKGTGLLGGITGVSYYVIFSENNCYVAQSNVELGIATLLAGNTLYLGSDAGITKVANLEELKNQSVYWG